MDVEAIIKQVHASATVPPLEFALASLSNDQIEQAMRYCKDDVDAGFRMLHGAGVVTDEGLDKYDITLREQPEIIRVAASELAININRLERLEAEVERRRRPN